ncbi:MAG: hypothetical protein HC904_14115 [Blastochloris sp.]|nr:hypothetical protein [Blastochloris sp.]
MKKMIRWGLAVVCAMTGAASVMAQGDGGPLIDALVKKGVLSSQEGEEIRADMTADLAATPGGMISWGSSAVKGVKIYGDARVRYQYDNNIQNNQIADEDRSRSRYRYRVRLGADYKFAENWNAGVRLETTASQTSTNSDTNGFFNKANGQDEARFGLYYLQYAANDPSVFGFSFADSVQLDFGKHAHPYYFNGVNGFLWDSDVNPEGFSQSLGWKDVGVSGLNITTRAGQYVIFSNDGQAAETAVTSEDDQFLFVAQLEAAYKINSDVNLKVAPLVLAQTGGRANASAGGGTLAGAEVNNLGQGDGTTLEDVLVFAIPAEINWKMWNQGFRGYATYGINLNGRERSDALTGVGINESYGQLFNVGMTMGRVRNKGSWDVTAEYRYVEEAAYTQFLGDSDFNGGQPGHHGFIVSSGYAFTDNIQGRVTYFNSENINPNTTLTSGQDQVLQVDLAWRF